MPSFEDFPIEITLRIISTAVRLLVIPDRQSAFQIAMICRATFTAAAPHLYRSLAIRWHPHDGPDSQSPESFVNVLKHVRHLYISNGQLHETWVIRLLAAWWPPAGTGAFIDVSLPQIEKTLDQIESHRYSGATGLRIVYGNFESAFLSKYLLPAEWRVHLTRVIAFIPNKRNLQLLQVDEELWVERVFSAAPSLSKLGLKVSRYQVDGDEAVFITTLEDMVRRFLLQKAVRSNGNALQLSQLCVQFLPHHWTEVFKSNLQSLVSRINDSRFTIWVDERLPGYRGTTIRDYSLNEDRDAVDVRARQDFWTPEDRPSSEAIVYRVGGEANFSRVEQNAGQQVMKPL